MIRHGVTQPGEHLFRTVDLGSARKDRAVDHQHRQAQVPGRDQLGLGAGAAGILAHHQVDGMILQQAHVGFDREWPAIDDQAVMGQGRALSRFVHEAQQIMMLGLGGEGIDMHSSQRQHDVPRRTLQSRDGRGDVAHMAPGVAGAGNPSRPGKREQLDTCEARGRDGIGAHGRSEGVRGVDQMGYLVFAQVGGQPRDAAKAADAHGNRLGQREPRPASIAQHSRDVPVRKQTGQRAGLGRAAEQEDVAHG